MVADVNQWQTSFSSRIMIRLLNAVFSGKEISGLPVYVGYGLIF
jgi:hypothetical protein